MQKAIPRVKIMETPMMNPVMACLMRRFSCCFDAEEVVEQGGSTPPQRPALPIRSLGLMVVSIPLEGTGPSSLLNDKFTISKAGEVPKFAGIRPTRELLDRSSM